MQTRESVREKLSEVARVCGTLTVRSLLLKYDAQASLDNVMTHNLNDLYAECLRAIENKTTESAPATQEWMHKLSIMQQSVLLSGIRGCDGLPKFHKAKQLIKWYRRCILISAFDGRVLKTPYESGGGSFTGHIQNLNQAADDFINSRDELPAHYQTHMMHSFEILGYKHPDLDTREFWQQMYVRMAKAYHLWPETEQEMDNRLGDNLEGWEERNDKSSTCSD